MATRTLDLLVDDAELERRRRRVEAAAAAGSTTACCGKYAKLVGSAAQGAVCG